MKRDRRLAALSLMLLLSNYSPAIAQPQPSSAPADRATLETGFAKKLTNARLTGFYAIEGRQGPPQQDQYTLRKVEKGEGDKWLFTAVIEYGNRSFAVPLEIPVLWAGDTPVISVTNLTIPGLGTYTARVMFYGDQYAGTWSSANHGGYLWGRIEHIDNNATTRSSQPSEK